MVLVIILGAVAVYFLYDTEGESNGIITGLAIAVTGLALVLIRGRRKAE